MSSSTRRVRPEPSAFNSTIDSLIHDLHVFRQTVEFMTTNAKTGLTLTVQGIEGEVPCNKKFISNLEDELRHRLLSLKSDFKAKKAPKARAPGQFTKPFYVSDQFRDFLSSVDIGEEIKHAKKDFKVVSKGGMVTPGLANSLVNAYQRRNGTKSGSVYQYTKDMEKHFKSTDLILGGTRLTESNISTSTSPERRQKLIVRLKEAGPSVKSRLEKEGSFSDGGYMPTCVVKIFNYFRIPNELLTQEQREALELPEHIEAVNRLSAISSGATRVANEAKLAEKSA